jgi:alpha-L-fucosidase
VRLRLACRVTCRAQKPSPILSHNVGPVRTGGIPDFQQRPLRELGPWLDGNGDASHESRAWTPTATITTGKRSA